MKGIRFAGLCACFVLAGSVFLPWVYITPLHRTLSGMDTGTSGLGKPGILALFLAGVILVFTLINRVWSKRFNLVLGAFLLAWTLRNFILYSQCQSAYCPQTLWGLYLASLCGLMIFIWTLLPADPIIKGGSGPGSGSE